MPEISRRSLLGIAAGLTAASAFPGRLAARETELREPDKPLVRGKPMKITLDMLNWMVVGVPLEERLAGTLAVTSVAAWLGARVFRAHQVTETRQALDMVAAIAKKCARSRQFTVEISINRSQASFANAVV